MRSLLIFILALFIANVSLSQPTIEDVIMPRYVQGVETGTLAKVPFVCRVTIKGLDPGKTYGYYGRFVADPDPLNTSIGAGYPIFVKPAGFKRVTSVTVNPTNANAGTFTTDALGSYTGWFACETYANAIFTPGKSVYFRVMLNNGNGGVSVSQRATSQKPVKVINFGSGVTDGTGIYSTAVTGATAKNFVFLYDNQAQPVTGSFIEDDGTDNTVANGYVDFYANQVNTVDRTWGTIIPNDMATGVQKIVQYSLADASEVGSKVATDGRWPISGGGRASTINTTGTTIVLDGAIARLDANKTDQNITFNPLMAKTYGDVDFSAGATSGSGQPLTYTSTNTSTATIVNGNIHVVAAGTTDIKAEHAGDGFFNPAAAQIQSLTVNKAVVTITANDDQILQGASLPTFTVSYSGFVNGENETVLTAPPAITTNATSVSGPGNYYIRPDNAAAANYTFTYVDGKLVISPSQQPQTITFSALSVVTYGTADIDPAATVNSPLVITYASSNINVATIVNGKIHIVGAGQTNITASQIGNGAFLPAADVIQPLTVNKAALTITAENKTRLVGQANPTFTFIYSGFVKGETSAVLTSPPVAGTVADAGTGAGKYKITVNGAVAANYNITYVDGELTIDPLASQTITFAALPIKKYGDADAKLTATASSNLPVTFSSNNPAVAIIRNDSLIIVGAGTAVITASQAGNVTYGSASAMQTLTVQKPRLIVQANNVTRNEGEPNPPLTIFYSGFVKNEDSTVLNSLPVATTIATASSIPGTYSITVSGAVTSNYTIAHMNGKLTVLPSQGASQDNVNAYINSPGQLRVNAYSVNGGKGVVQVFDLNGTRLVNLNVTLAKGYNSFQVPIGNVLPGIYNVRVTAAGVLLKTKVIIQ